MASYTYMEPEELVALLDDPAEAAKLTIVDCRDSDREAEGFILTSLHLPTATSPTAAYTALAERLAEEGKTTVVFHCALSQIRGPRGASRFAAVLRDLGRTVPRVCVLRGGFELFQGMYGKARPDLMYL
ncbi:As/Sb Reductase [Strigomonas culicis]|uniref:As/Sb Reductase n=1 Tax=Strigomonas culicis TaxID=28005 RepID=S9UY98_9TRYP|nr:As/Sb Reductase [Strigomonas culicis]|eukprot:EPY33714.1 As/Sb Reductase [Strigomonas culicis]